MTVADTLCLGWSWQFGYCLGIGRMFLSRGEWFGKEDQRSKCLLSCWTRGRSGTGPHSCCGLEQAGVGWGCASQLSLQSLSSHLSHSAPWMPPWACRGGGLCSPCLWTENLHKAFEIHLLGIFVSSPNSSVYVMWSNVNLIQFIPHTVAGLSL